MALTALHRAVKTNNLDLVILLLNQDADVNAAGRYFLEGCGSDYSEVRNLDPESVSILKYSLQIVDYLR
jgi:ankyrin repeat protein